MVTMLPGVRQSVVELKPWAVSVPLAPTVIVWASLRPPGPPNVIVGELCEKPSCSFADTLMVKSRVATCGTDA